MLNYGANIVFISKKETLTTLISILYLERPPRCVDFKTKQFPRRRQFTLPFSTNENESITRRSLHNPNTHLRSAHRKFGQPTGG